MSAEGGLRLDHGFLTAPVMAGVLCSGLYVLFTHGEQHRIGEVEGNAIGVLASVAALLFLIGSFLPDWRLAFRLELVGLVGIIAGFAVLDFTVDLSLIEQMTFTGGLGFWVQIGCARLAYRLWRALRAVPET